VADNYGRVAAWIARVPAIVSTVHNVEKWKENWALRWIDTGTGWLADHFITCSSLVREHLRQLNLVPMDKVTVIHNGIRLPDLNSLPGDETLTGIRRELGIKPEDYVIGVIARLEPQKGHRYLIEAVAALRQEIPHLRLLIVGEGSLRSALEQQACSSGLSSQIIFTGGRRDIAALNLIMDLVVLPSLWEGLPIALLESLALGRTVIATNVGGVSEVIHDQANGLLAPPKNAFALANTIRRCWENPDLAHTMAMAGLHTVKDRFSIRNNANKVIALYNQMMGNKSAVTSDLVSAGK
jgi:glycosyltransferase involved in cell wall biosynthesis